MVGDGDVLVAVQEVGDRFLDVLRRGGHVVDLVDHRVVGGEAELDLAQGLFLREDDQLGELDQLRGRGGEGGGDGPADGL